VVRGGGVEPLQHRLPVWLTAYKTAGRNAPHV